MSYQIEISPDAQKEIRALPGYVRAQALDIIDALAETPRPLRAKELRDKPNIYRIWLAKTWRIVYAIDDDIVYVTVLRVRTKAQIDYDSVS